MSTKIQEKYELLPKLGFEQGIKRTYKHYEKNR
jgi:dTDP-D-glucose 4,6-dehydratase